MSSLWTLRWNSFVDQPFVTHVETIFYGFDGVMVAVGQIWVEGQFTRRTKEFVIWKWHVYIQLWVCKTRMSHVTLVLFVTFL